MLLLVWLVQFGSLLNQGSQKTGGLMEEVGSQAMLKLSFGDGE